MKSSEVLPMIGAVVGSAITYITFRIKNSGKIKVSEAQDLWKAEESFRSSLLKRIEELEKYAEKQSITILRQEEEIGNLRIRHDKCEDLIFDLRAQLREIRNDQAHKE